MCCMVSQVLSHLGTLFYRVYLLHTFYKENHNEILPSH